MSLGGRSKCFSCSKNLEWHELIPFFSFIFQKGECKKCKSKISWQYPIIEALSGVLFIMIFYYFPPTTLASSFNIIFYLLITCLLIIITIYDIKHKIIPDPLVYLFAFVAFAKLFISPDLAFQLPQFMDILAGPILALPFLFIWVVSKGKWMGFGDVKLILAIGWTLGLMQGVSAVTLAFWIAAVVSVIWMYVIFRKIKSRYEIPFGPYLILGMYLVLFFKIQVFDLGFLNIL